MTERGWLQLGPLEERLALFAEGIAGRYFHIKPVAEHRGRRMLLDPAAGAITADTLYLPERLPGEDPAAYRVLALQQLCRREFGSYRFEMAVAVARVPGLTDHEVPALGTRASDFERFYHQFRHPALASRLLHLCDAVRVDALMVRRYPGIRRHLDAWNRRRLATEPVEPATDLATVLQALELVAGGLDPEAVGALDGTGLLAPAAAELAAIEAKPGDVYQAASAAARLHDRLAALAGAERTGVALPLPDEGDPAHWLQREARLEDWRDELAALDASLAVESLDARDAETGQGRELAAGELRPEDLDLGPVRERRDSLARRVDMERSAVRDAMGPSPAGARSFRYDEWDYLNRRYLPRWCRVFEQPLEPDLDADLAALEQVIRRHRPGARKRLEQIKPLGFQRVFRLADGDELDFNAVIGARQDIRAGHTPDERVYSRRDRIHRDVCAAFLVDLSASTDDRVEPAEPEPARRIIDVQREAMLVMSAALEQIGDSYGVYGFSGYGRDCVEVFVAKEPDERFSRRTLAAIAGMKPKRSTRMGPAIRHAVYKLLASGNALKVLLIISDGFPQDCDYGPERGAHEYGVQDTARALREAHEKGVETFCVTVDRSGHDYLKRMCPEARYLVIEEVEDLPEQLTKVYEALTA